MGRLAKTAWSVGLLLAISAALAGHVLGMPARQPAPSGGFGGPIAHAHRGTIERYRDPETRAVLMQVPCEGTRQPATRCYVAADRPRPRKPR